MDTRLWCFTLANARQFNSSKGDLLDRKGLNDNRRHLGSQPTFFLWMQDAIPRQPPCFLAQCITTLTFNKKICAILTGSIGLEMTSFRQNAFLVPALIACQETSCICLTLQLAYIFRCCCFGGKRFHLVAAIKMCDPFYIRN